MSAGGSIVDATIADLSTALASRRLASVDLVAKYLLRISIYDCRGISLNSIPLINENVFEEAAAADDRRATGHMRGTLDGIPFTVKDSYKVRGMTVASGSDAFEKLVANEDAFTVKALREAGAVLMGRTNMCPMAYGGMLRGVYGRAESPYNMEYLPAAFGSGSSNGSGVSVAASLAAFGMGEETVSSGRSPASNNALVAYTPSRGLISIRGNWPLYPTCDVVVPHTRSMDDLFVLLDVLSGQDATTTGDFWRDQPFVQLLPSPWSDGSQPSNTPRSIGCLKGKRIAVPKVFLEQQGGGPHISVNIGPLWRRAHADLVAAGASVEIIPNLPFLRAYEQMQHKPENEDEDATSPLPYLPDEWNAVERGVLIAQAWEDFLQSNDDPLINSLSQVQPTQIFPHLPHDDPQIKFTEPGNAILWDKLASYVVDSTLSTRPDKSPIYDTPHLGDAAKALEQIRIRFFEDWMSAQNYDMVVFPAVGDVACANADVDDRSAQHAWTDGVKYSHCGRALRHLGIPSVTVPMGILEGSRMPMGLTFLTRAYEDVSLLQAGYAYEQISKRRVVPPLTPPLQSDEIPKHGRTLSGTRPTLSVTKCSATSAADGRLRVSIEGALSAAAAFEGSFSPLLDIYIDGQKVPVSLVSVDAPTIATQTLSRFRCEHLTAAPPLQDNRNRVIGRVARDSTMVVVIARNGKEGRPSGYVKLLQ